MKLLELPNSIKNKKLKGVILKIDLAKDFDRVSWLYIKLILTHMGFPPPFIDWIMCYITSASFSVLINGSASHFFHAEQGLRQRYPLSPLLFLIVMEGLNASAKRDGQWDSSTFHDILTLSALATGMEANHSKSTITLSYTSLQEARIAHQFLPFQHHHLEDGLKYLGFWLKPHCYRIGDWIWLVIKIEKRLTHWNHRFLSRVSHLVVIKSILEATPVYWMSLAWIPKGILAQIQNICCRFLWNGYKEGKPFT
eukprot:PITA_33341